MKLQKILFTALLLVGAKNFTMDNVGSERDGRMSPKELPASGASRDLAGPGPEFFQALSQDIAAGRVSSKYAKPVSLLNFASKKRGIVIVDGCADKAGCTLAALTQKKILNESPEYNPADFMNRKIEVEHPGFVSQVRGMVAIMDITGVAPKTNKDGKLFFPLKDNRPDYSHALSVVKPFDVPGVLPARIAECTSKHGQMCNLSCLNLPQQFRNLKRTAIAAPAAATEN